MGSSTPKSLFFSFNYPLVQGKAHLAVQHEVLLLIEGGCGTILPCAAAQIESAAMVRVETTMSYAPVSDKTDVLFGKIVTVIGGSGFVGRHLAESLCARGARVCLASRHPEKASSIKTLSNLGQMEGVRVDVTKPETLLPVMTGSDFIVNLVGAFDGDLDAIQGAGIGRLAHMAKQAGVTAFVHISALGGGQSSGVAYARTKAEGEAAVLAAFPEATILRPSLIFGPDDKLVSMFAGLIESLPFLPVFAPDAKMQPVFVQDVAEAISTVLETPEAYAGKTFDLGGPEVLTMAELNQRIATAQGREGRFIPLSDGFGSLIARLPGTPITSDQYALLKAGSVVGEGSAGFAELGISPRPLGLFLDRWMMRYRRNGRFGKPTNVTI